MPSINAQAEVVGSAGKATPRLKLGECTGRPGSSQCFTHVFFVKIHV